MVYRRLGNRQLWFILHEEIWGLYTSGPHFDMPWESIFKERVLIPSRFKSMLREFGLLGGVIGRFHFNDFDHWHTLWCRCFLGFRVQTFVSLTEWSRNIWDSAEGSMSHLLGTTAVLLIRAISSNCDGQDFSVQNFPVHCKISSIPGIHCWTAASSPWDHQRNLHMILNTPPKPYVPSV